MARNARVVIPGCPHHITHRGNLRAEAFFTDDDRRFYLEMLETCARRFGVRIWAYRLMTNHIYLIAVPEREESLAQCLGLAHQRYSSATNATNATNARHGWTGNLWANRFYSTALDEEHLWQAVRYVELSPVRAVMAESALDYLWSSARCHAGLEEASVLDADGPFPGPEAGWNAYLARGLTGQDLEKLRRNTSTGRPTGPDEFVRTLEEQTGRVLRPLKRGAKPATSTGPELTDDFFTGRLD